MALCRAIVKEAKRIRREGRAGSEDGASKPPAEASGDGGSAAPLVPQAATRRAPRDMPPLPTPPPPPPAAGGSVASGTFLEGGDVPPVVPLMTATPLAGVDRVAVGMVNGAGPAPGPGFGLLASAMAMRALPPPPPEYPLTTEQLASPAMRASTAASVATDSAPRAMVLPAALDAGSGSAASSSTAFGARVPNAGDHESPTKRAASDFSAGLGLQGTFSSIPTGAPPSSQTSTATTVGDDAAERAGLLLPPPTAQHPRKPGAGGDVRGGGSTGTGTGTGGCSEVGAALPALPSTYDSVSLGSGSCSGATLSLGQLVAVGRPRDCGFPVAVTSDEEDGSSGAHGASAGLPNFFPVRAQLAGPLALATMAPVQPAPGQRASASGSATAPAHIVGVSDAGLQALVQEAVRRELADRVAVTVSDALARSGILQELRQLARSAAGADSATGVAPVTVPMHGPQAGHAHGFADSFSRTSSPANSPRSPRAHAGAAPVVGPGFFPHGGRATGSVLAAAVPVGRRSRDDAATPLIEMEGVEGPARSGSDPARGQDGLRRTSSVLRVRPPPSAAELRVRGGALLSGGR